VNGYLLEAHSGNEGILNNPVEPIQTPKTNFSAAATPGTLYPAVPSQLAIWVALSAVYVLWGSTYLGIRFAIETIPTFFMAAARWIIAGTAMYLFARLRGAKAPARQHWLQATIVGTCLIVGGNGGVTFAERYLPSGLTALLVATVAIFLTVFGWWFRMTPRPRAAIFVALLLGLVGVAILSQANPNDKPTTNWNIGIAASLFASAIFAAGSLYSRRSPRPGSAILWVGMQMICGGILLAAIGLVMGEGAHFQLAAISPKSLWALAYLVLFGSIIGYSAYVWVARVCQPSLFGTYSFVNPVVAVLLGWIFAGEQINLQVILGAAIVVSAVAIIVLQPGEKARR
jgi:drug/metabolite transporter (DMT)-like permease